MKRVGFRARLFLFLLAFALVPSVLLTLAWGATIQWALPLVGATAALESIAASGERAIAAAQTARLTPAEKQALEAHGRMRALEAERAAAFRETARQVAHELKNPLTPIRFAVDRLRRSAPEELRQTVEVLAVESERLEQIARAFAQFGRLPEGPRAPVDMGELVRYTARATVPADIPLAVDVADDVPMVNGHLDALARAVSNVLINAVEACGPNADRGRVAVRVTGTKHRGRDAVEVVVADSGCGIPADRISRIWDPYVTSKPGGTGLGLAIVRQTVAAHSGDVAAESSPGAGTTIRLVLPADNAAVAAPAFSD